MIASAQANACSNLATLRPCMIKTESLATDFHPPASKHLDGLRLQTLCAIQNATGAQALAIAKGRSLHRVSAQADERVVAHPDRPRWPLVGGLHRQLQRPALRDAEQLAFNALHAGEPSLGNYKERQAYMLLNTSLLIRVALLGQPP